MPDTSSSGWLVQSCTMLQDCYPPKHYFLEKSSMLGTATCCSVTHVLHRHPLRPAHGVHDGQPHVGPAQLGQHRRVLRLHHAMHDALGVHHDVDVVVAGAEQVVGLQAWGVAAVEKAPSGKPRVRKFVFTKAAGG